MLEDIVNNEIAQKLAENSDKLNQSGISIIHPEIFLKYSSVNIFCGRQGKGLFSFKFLQFKLNIIMILQQLEKH